MQGMQFGPAGARSFRVFAWAPVALVLAVLVSLAGGATASAVSCEGGCGASVADDGRVWFTSFDRLTTDANRTENLYLRAGDETTLLTPGAENGLAELSMSVTPVGSRVFVASKADLDPDDPAFGDQDPDLFELRGDSWKIWTTGPNDQPTGTDWFWRSLISEDGRYVYFESMQRLTAADQDDELDVYQRYAGQTRLITIPAAGVLETSGQSWRTHLANIAPDGETAYFFAFERMTLDDSEALSPDLFAWRDGQTTRITGGTNDTIYEPTDLVGASPGRFEGLLQQPPAAHSGRYRQRNGRLPSPAGAAFDACIPGGSWDPALRAAPLLQRGGRRGLSRRDPLDLLRLGAVSPGRRRLDLGRLYVARRRCVLDLEGRGAWEPAGVVRRDVARRAPGRPPDRRPAPGVRQRWGQ